MTDIQEQSRQDGAVASSQNGAAGRTGDSGPTAKRGTLTTMLLPELQQVAKGLGISTTRVKKNDLIAAIQAAGGANGSKSNGTARRSQSAGRVGKAADGSAPAESASDSAPEKVTDTSANGASTHAAPSTAPTVDATATDAADSDRSSSARRRPRSTSRSADRDLGVDGDSGAQLTSAPTDATEPQGTHNDRTGTQARERNGQQRSDRRRGSHDGAQPDTQHDAVGDAPEAAAINGNGGSRNGAARHDTARTDTARNGASANGASANGASANGASANGASANGASANGAGPDGVVSGDHGAQATQHNGTSDSSSQLQRQDDDDFDGGRRRGRRYRDRRGRNRDRQGGVVTVPGTAASDNEPTVGDEDVLVSIAGVVDCIEDKNAWFVRVDGFFASSDDIFIANQLVRRYNLRRGDAITGVVRQVRDGERREKYNPLVRVDTMNGLDPDQLRNRVEFTKLTPLYPQQRLRLETEPHILTTRVIDLVMPIGKGQRALIVSPPKAGKTSVLQSIANAIATNNPECHLMVVLVDERPEEVTDMQRSVRGEVIASTFDRRPHDHTMVAELSIERAKRLVEMGKDVVVLLDSITRLGRAYNLAAPASGRILSGGVDSTALYPPKRFLGAARNIENGGSLTILATALVETGSAGDTVIFEEFKGTGNAELKLDRKIADKRVFPAVDVDQSSTRKDELLLAPDELAVTIKLRRVLHSLEPQQAMELLLDRLRKSRTNIEFLMQIAKSTPGAD